MNITFANNKLEKYANDDRFAVRKLGPRQAELYKQRMDDLSAATSLEDTRYLPGNYHELVADRKGEWACDLLHPQRLVFTPHEDPIPVNEDGQYIWDQITGVHIEEIIDYH